jgi:UDP-glucose 4-epimerase
MRRVLITGVSSYWGGRLAQVLERDPEIETIVGVSPEDPTLALERTEFVRVGTEHALLRRIVHAAQIDTVVDARLVVDSRTAEAKPVTSPLGRGGARGAHEQNVMGTMNILAACGGPDSPVRKVVFKSSAHYYGCERDDPSFFTEDMRRLHPPATRLESDIVEADDAVQGFASRNPGVTVTTLRFCDGLGPDLRTSHTALLSLPAVPGILGFDPRYQFIHEDDIVGALAHAVTHELPGIYNAAPDGVLVLSEVASLLGKRYLPLLPPWGTGPAAAALGLARLRFPDEIRRQLRYGRGLDNRRLKQSGFRFGLTSRETVQAFAEALRLAPLRESAGAPYRYEREVEEFLRWSPSVRRGPDS